MCQVLVCKDFARLDRPQTIREEGGLYAFTLVTVDKVLTSDQCCEACECVLHCVNCFLQLPHVFGCSSREELLRWTSAFERCVAKDSVQAVHARCRQLSRAFCRYLSSVLRSYLRCIVHVWREIMWKWHCCNSHSVQVHRNECLRVKAASKVRFEAVLVYLVSTRRVRPSRSAAAFTK